MSDDSFLLAVENGTFSIENGTDPIASPVNESVQTDNYRSERLIIAFLRNEVGLKLRDDFRMSDLKETLQKREVLLAGLKNEMNRKHQNSPHNPKLKEIIVKHALKFSVASAISSL